MRLKRHSSQLSNAFNWRSWRRQNHFSEIVRKDKAKRRNRRNWTVNEIRQNGLNYYDPEETLKLEEGMVIAWEPYVSTGAIRAIENDDEWNLTTHNQSDVAQFEHTILVTNDKPEILTIIE